MFEMMIGLGIDKLGSWGNISTGPIGIREAPTVYYNGQLFILGGITSTYLNTIRTYTFTTKSWSNLSVYLPKAISRSSACVIGGIIYMYGGFAGNTTYGDLVKIDLGQGKVTNLAAGLPSYGHTVGVYGGKMYVYGGINELNGVSNILRRYDPITDQWTLIDNVGASPTRRTDGCGGVVGDNFFIIGGMSQNPGAALKDIEVYSLTNNKWLDKIPITFPIHSAGSAIIGNKIYVTGGFSNTGTTGNSFVFDATTLIARSIAPHGIPRRYNSGVTDGTSFYTFGGLKSDNTTNIDTLDKFIP